MFDTLEYDYETLHTRMREQAFLNAGLRITITDGRGPARSRSDDPCAMRAASGSSSPGSTATRLPCTSEVIYLAGAKERRHRRGRHAV